MDCPGKGSLKMKTKLFFSVLLLAAAVAPGALAAGDDSETNARTRNGQSLVTPAEQSPSANFPSVPAVVPADPPQALPDYDSLMVALTQKFSATLTAIGEAVARGELSSEQAVEMSAQQYQLTQMQFELLSLWREIGGKDSARISDDQSTPDPGQKNEIVVVALPFSSLQLNSSLVEYLNLSQSQVEAIQQLMLQEQQNLEPLMTELQATRAKLLAVSSEHINEKEVKGLADREANVLAKLIVANARMQSKIYKLLNPDQQKKLNDLERTQGAATMEVR
jgi:Spy/CpxP family protein refolding chaperone